MDLRQLIPQKLSQLFKPPITPPQVDWFGYRLGQPQRSGPLTVVPIFGRDHKGKYAPPLSGLKLSRVAGYGNVELFNPSSEGVAIVPLHMGYIQDQAQNHALCRSAFLAQGQKLMFKDACCVQQGQGGYLQERDQWFFILPLQLRHRALALRGETNFGKLWQDISQLNQQFGFPTRGHLEQILSRERAYLTQYRTRFELLPEQTGAMFLLHDKLVGVELAPNVSYFAEVWMPLVCFCYGTAAMYEELKHPVAMTSIEPYPARNLTELKTQLQLKRQESLASVQMVLAQTPVERFEPQEEERFLTMRLFTVQGKNFAGQLVDDEGELIYLSLFAKPAYLRR